WHGGAEIKCGDRRYLLHADLLTEIRSADGTLVWRQAVARQLSPEPKQEARYVWLRQTEARAGIRPGRAGGEALVRENRILGRLRARPGLPQAGLVVAEGDTTTLVLSWPVAPRSGIPSPTLDRAMAFGDPR